MLVPRVFSCAIPGWHSRKNGSHRTNRRSSKNAGRIPGGKPKARGRWGGTIRPGELIGRKERALSKEWRLSADWPRERGIENCAVRMEPTGSRKTWKEQWPQGVAELSPAFPLRWGQAVVALRWKARRAC